MYSVMALDSQTLMEAFGSSTTGGEAVRVHLSDEGWLLELGGCPDLRCVGDGQLFEEKSDFLGFGPARGGMLAWQ
jgi:hypothetical protein